MQKYHDEPKQYKGYLKSALMEVIDTKFFTPDERSFSSHSDLYREREDLIHNGKLLHFRQIDRKLELSLGTAKRLLKVVATRYKLVPNHERGCATDC